MTATRTRRAGAGLLAFATFVGLPGCDSGNQPGQLAVEPGTTRDSRDPATAPLEKRTAGGNQSPAADTAESAVDSGNDAPSAEPAAPSLTQILEVIDLRDVGLPSKGTIPRRLAGFYSCVSGITAEEAKAFLHEQLTNLGCKPISSVYQSVDQMYVDLFEKNGYQIITHASRQTETLGGLPQSSVAIMNQGALDVRGLPMLADAVATESTKASISYTTPGSIADAADQVSARLATAGWRDYREETALESDGLRILGFVRGGHRLQVIVFGPGYLGDNPGTVVRYNMGIRNFELPLPPEAKDLVLDDIQGRLRCETPVSLEGVVDFYRKRFDELGWEQNDRFGHSNDDSATTVYQRGSDSTWVELSQESGLVKVRLKGLRD